MVLVIFAVGYGTIIYFVSSVTRRTAIARLVQNSMQETEEIIVLSSPCGVRTTRCTRAVIRRGNLHRCDRYSNGIDQCVSLFLVLLVFVNN
jgi:hypothetical protein